MFYKSKYLSLLVLPILLLICGGAFSQSAGSFVAELRQQAKSGDVTGQKNFEPLLVLLRSDINDRNAMTFLEAIRHLGSSDPDSPAEFKQYAYQNAPQILLNLVR